MNTLDELYAERGEWLDSQGHITTQLDKDGYYREPDPRITAKIADLTEQIEIVENLQWLAEVEAQTENIVFVSNIGGASLYLDVDAAKKSVAAIKARYEASINHSNDDFWQARRNW